MYTHEGYFVSASSEPGSRQRSTPCHPQDGRRKTSNIVKPVTSYLSNGFILVVSPARGNDFRMEHVLSMATMLSGSIPWSCRARNRTSGEK